MNLTPYINKQNVETVQDLIKQKNNGLPFTVSNQATADIKTDIDSWPYNRYYRGIPSFSNPVIMEREAGFRQLDNNCYKPITVLKPRIEPDITFTPPCTTILPSHKDIYSQFEMR